ncbi:MAG: PAS domain S-box protein [Acidobacteriaceae bacterium]|nr:PAS domain S-box protein [Acidobacteriaceae bacterium]
MLSAILDNVAALIVVLDHTGHIVRFNRACEQASGFSFEEVKGKHFLDVAFAPDEREHFGALFERFRLGTSPAEFESYWTTRNGARRFIGWTIRALTTSNGYVIATGVDRTERKHLEQAILETSGREQRRIGQDLHDGLGQHLTGIAFLSKAHEQKLADKSMPEAADASKIVGLVNEAIYKARQLARGLLPVLSDSFGLMSALQQWASEVEELFQVECRFDCEEPVRNLDETCATHLYHVAQEAVHNAIKHGKATRILIELSAGEDSGVLTVLDNGCGIPEAPRSRTGIGLRIMEYRAGMIGGRLRVERGKANGTLITCTFSIRKRARAAGGAA